MIIGDFGGSFAEGTYYQFAFGGNGSLYGGVETEYDFDAPAYLSHKKVRTFQGQGAYPFTVNSITYLLFKNADQNAVMQTQFYRFSICERGLGAAGIWLDHDATYTWVTQNIEATFTNIANGSAYTPRIIYGRFVRSFADHNAYHTLTLHHPDYEDDIFTYSATWEDGAYKTALDVAVSFKTQLIAGLTNQTINAFEYLPAVTSSYKPRLWTAEGVVSGNGADTILMRTVSADDLYHDDDADLRNELRIGDTFKVSSAPTPANEYIVANISFANNINTITIKTSGTGIPNGNLKTTVEAFSVANGTITSSSLVIQENEPAVDGVGVTLSGTVHTDLMVKGFKNDPIFIQTDEAKEGAILVETPDYILNQESSRSNINKVYISFKDESYYHNGRFTVEYAIGNKDEWKAMYLKHPWLSESFPVVNIPTNDTWQNPSLYFNENFSSLKGVDSIRFRITGIQFQSFKLNDINILFRDKHVS